MVAINLKTGAFASTSAIGIVYYFLNPDNKIGLEDIKKERGYTHEDEIVVSRAAIPDFDARMVEFFREHKHEDEEIRYILGGQAIFDVRDQNDEWIRMTLGVGDLIVLPAGCWHRFMVAPGIGFTRAKRLYRTTDKWKAIPREIK